MTSGCAWWPWPWPGPWWGRAGAAAGRARSRQRAPRRSRRIDRMRRIRAVRGQFGLPACDEHPGPDVRGAPRCASIPRPMTEPRFTFGLWTVGNPGRDPFGDPTRAPVDPVDSVHKLAELGAWGVSLHDDDLIPWGVSASERDRIVARFKAALEETGMGVGMATTNLFGHPAFKDGAFVSNDRRVRRAAIGKAMRSIDLGAELGAEVFVCWGGREGTEAGAAKDPRDALDRYREAVDALVAYSESQRYGLRFAIETKPNEPRGDLFLPTIGHALHFVTTLERPDLVGLN